MAHRNATRDPHLLRHEQLSLDLDSASRKGARLFQDGQLEPQREGVPAGAQAGHRASQREIRQELQGAGMPSWALWPLTAQESEELRTALQGFGQVSRGD